MMRFNVREFSNRIFTSFSVSKCYATTPVITTTSKKKKLGKLGAVLEKKVLPVETDANKLVNYVCGSNILKEGGEDVKLKPDNEYPDWLWKLYTGKPKRLEEMDPNSREYLFKVRKMAIVERLKLKKFKKW